MRRLRTAVAWLLAGVMVVWRHTCRYRIDAADPRPALRRQGRPYVFALLHAHQVGAVFVNDERRLSAMVSRSADGDLLVPSLRARRVRAVRGSTRKGQHDKGGRAALQQLADGLGQAIPALLAVDGPRGPRNHVHRGVAELARSTGASIVPVVVTASRRFILTRTWDRMQLPAPFSTVSMFFADPITPRADETLDGLRHRVAHALQALELCHDAGEAQRRPLPAHRAASALDGGPTKTPEGLTFD